MGGEKHYKQCADGECGKYASKKVCGKYASECRKCGGELSEAETTLSLEEALKNEALVKLDLIVPDTEGRHIELTNFLVMPGVIQFGKRICENIIIDGNGIEHT